MKTTSIPMPSSHFNRRPVAARDAPSEPEAQDGPAEASGGRLLLFVQGVLWGFAVGIMLCAAYPQQSRGLSHDLHRTVESARSGSFTSWFLGRE